MAYHPIAVVCVSCSESYTPNEVAVNGKGEMLLTAFCPTCNKPVTSEFTLNQVVHEAQMFDISDGEKPTDLADMIITTRPM